MISSLETLKILHTVFILKQIATTHNKRNPEILNHRIPVMHLKSLYIGWYKSAYWLEEDEEESDTFVSTFPFFQVLFCPSQLLMYACWVILNMKSLILGQQTKIASLKHNLLSFLSLFIYSLPIAHYHCYYLVAPTTDSVGRFIYQPENW